MKNKLLRRIDKFLNPKTPMTFTKVWMNRLLWFFILCVACSYVLAFLGKPTMTGLSKAIVTVGIVGGFLGYMTKSFFETKEEEKNKMQKQSLESEEKEDE